MMPLAEIEKEMKSLNTNEASYSFDIPTNNLKQNIDFFFSFYIRLR